MKLSELMWILGEVRPEQRKRNMFDFSNLVAYHVTPKSNVASIKANGLQARSSQQSYDRPASVYLFCDPSEISGSIPVLFGQGVECQVLRVSIPVEYVMRQMVWDGLFNSQFGTYSAVQIFANIPAEWITF